MRRAGRSLAILALALALPACGGKSRSASSPLPGGGNGGGLSPDSAVVAVGEVQTFSVSLAGTPESAITWSVNGIPGGNADVGTIQATPGGAQYTPRGIPSSNPVTITATSQTDPALSDSSTVVVEYPNDTAQAQAFPVRLGTSGGNVTDTSTGGASVRCCSGTLGCLVRRDGELFILSNSHVLGKAGRGAIGDAISQPGLVDNQCAPGSLVATYAQSAPIETSNVDAALARIHAGAVDPSGAILDLGPAGSARIEPAPPSATLAEPWAVMSGNRRVAKAGRSTGLTCATLVSVNTDVSVDYAESCDGPATFTQVFRNQLMIDGAGFSQGGDSGSLIVTSDTARPLGLLYAGSENITVANPIADVLNALRNPTTGEVPTIVGGPDHPISCAPMSKVTPAKASEPPPSTPELARATAAKELMGSTLLDDPAVKSIAVGTSADNPKEGALLVYVDGTPRGPLPRHLGGVRTRIVRLGDPGRGPEPERVRQAAAVKDRQSAGLLQRRGVVGVGVGRSADADDEPALVVYVERDAAGVDVELDGVRTRVVEGERFRTYGWGRAKVPGGSCCGD